MGSWINDELLDWWKCGWVGGRMDECNGIIYIVRWMDDEIDEFVDISIDTWIMIESMGD